MKAIIKKIILRLFNWLFSSDVTPDDLPSIRILSREKLRLAEKDVEAVRLVTSEGLHITQKDVEAVRLVLKGVDEQSVNCIRLLCDNDPEFVGELNSDLLQQLKAVALLKRLDEIGDLSEGFQVNYAQEGEALILNRFFDFRKEGFFVDIGAHHPKRFSNTYSFYKLGWRGVNIDPTPGVKEIFDEVRPEDISLSVAVSNVDGRQDFYMFSEPALNTFSPQMAQDYQHQGCKLIEVRSIETRRLATLLDQYHIDRPIDFMSIDVEDHELPVLQSNDWTRFRPKVLLVEILNFDMKHPDASPVHNFILNEGYELFAKTFNTVFYKDAR